MTGAKDIIDPVPSQLAPNPARMQGVVNIDISLDE
jgi:hypothetical protein